MFTFKSSIGKLIGRHKLEAAGLAVGSAGLLLASCGSQVEQCRFKLKRDDYKLGYRPGFSILQRQDDNTDRT